MCYSTSSHREQVYILYKRRLSTDVLILFTYHFQVAMTKRQSTKVNQSLMLMWLNSYARCVCLYKNFWMYGINRKQQEVKSQASYACPVKRLTLSVLELSALRTWIFFLVRTEILAGTTFTCKSVKSLALQMQKQRLFI